MLVTLTTIIIEMDVIKTMPRAFESFMDVLFEIIGHINSGPDRILRETVPEPENSGLTQAGL